GRIAREIGEDLAKLWDQATQLFMDTARDLGWGGRGGHRDADPLKQLERLADLRDKGVITEAEFQAKKAELLSKV
ncbi:MAG TPA: SHOCT domain-containing protein, partial [Miltoncostaeaceae bacterium]|nr:SHOCT domain-containing protein [Miltoncostaeaceae bacterium]